MKLRIKNYNNRTQNEDIIRLETVVGRPLPEPYRAFLLEYNGGGPEPRGIDIEGAPFQATDVHVLYGIDAKRDSNDILWNWEILTGCKENLLLPIAHDSFGHPFTLVLEDEDYGQVYYFDSKENPPRPYFVANDFNAFLSKIRGPVLEEEEPEIDSRKPRMYRFVTITDPGRKLSDADIERLEKSLGLPLPKYYKWWLELFNGGVPSPNILDIQEAPVKTTRIAVFFSFEAEDPERDLLHHWEIIDGPRIGLLPVGRDEQNRYIVVGVGEESPGMVFCLIEEDAPGAYWLASDFDDFLDLLREPNRAEQGLPELVDVKRKFSGSRPKDAALANAQAGHETTPRGHVWHRHQDGETLQLVPKDVHKKTGDPKGYTLRWRSST